MKKVISFILSFLIVFVSAKSEFGMIFDEVVFSARLVKGDISGNGNIDLYDAVEITKYIMGNRNLTEEEKNVADFNNDGKINLYDIIDIAVYILKNNSVEAFNYLAIGNSITKHGICNYWWNEAGMAASTAENDYFHLVTNYLKENNPKVVSNAYNFFIWEAQSYDRAETYIYLDNYLKENLDLISVQLSENATDLTTFEVDFIDLIEYIRNKCPHAQIVIVDDFWSDEKSITKKQVALKCDVKFADLSEIRNDENYKCGLNTIVYDESGEEHIVEHNGVAIHPGDMGMRYIAGQICSLINQ